jgi:hypothetical protein
MAKTKAPHNEQLEERLCEATMAILQNVPANTLNIVLVNKALFYSDLWALREHGNTITGSIYLGLPQGPVVASYEKRLVRSLMSRGWAIQLQDGDAKPLKVVKAQKAFPELNPQQLQILSSIAKQIAGLTSTGASELSHKNRAWEKAYNRGLKAGKPAAPLNMMLAMQQLPMGDDGWLSAPTTPDEAAAFAAADCEAGEPWT